MGIAAISELWGPLFYLLTGVFGLVFLVKTFTVKKSAKPWTLVRSIACLLLFVNYKSCNEKQDRRNQLSKVGIYHLTSYPNCDSCYLELKEDMTYDVSYNGKVFEQNGWYYKMGGDYSFVELNKRGGQLGSGDYTYEQYKLKYPDLSN